MTLKATTSKPATSAIKIRRTELRNREPLDPHDTPEVDTRLIWALLFFCVAAFAKFPQIDLVIASHYFQPGVGFVYRQNPVVLALYHWTPLIGRTLILLLALFWGFNGFVAAWFRKRGQSDLADKCQGPWRQLAVLAVVSALLGPGLLIEGIFKNVAGRPRPVQVVELGGNVPYRGPFQWGDDPGSHKSFVSSHAAAGFALMSLGLTCGPVWRRRWLLIGTVTGGAVGLGRMLQGGHFFSDILFAFYAVWVCNELVLMWSRRQPPSRTQT